MNSGQGTCVSVIICTYCRPAQLLRLLHALQEQEQPADEILVIDASPDDSTTRARKP